MNRWSVAFIAVSAAVAGCANQPPALSSADGQRLTIERPHAAEALIQQGMTPQGVGASSDSAGGVVGPEYWKY